MYCIYSYYFVIYPLHHPIVLISRIFVSLILCSVRLVFTSMTTILVSMIVCGRALIGVTANFFIIIGWTAIFV